MGRITKDMLQEVLANGGQWAVKEGYGKKEDYEKTEDSGNLKGDPHAVSERAFKRGMPQLGSLGAGNHFLEVQEIQEIFDPKIAKIFGVDEKGNVTIMIHCGSRGLGHQVASDYVKEMEGKYGFENLPDRELINAPINSDLGQKYLGAMNAAANYAFANKQMITHWVRESINKVLGNVAGPTPTPAPAAPAPDMPWKEEGVSETAEAEAAPEATAEDDNDMSYFKNLAAD